MKFFEDPNYILMCEKAKSGMDGRSTKTIDYLQNKPSHRALIALLNSYMKYYHNKQWNPLTKEWEEIK